MNSLLASHPGHLLQAGEGEMTCLKAPSPIYGRGLG